MTVVPIIVLIAGAMIFKAKFILNDAKVAEISDQLSKRQA